MTAVIFNGKEFVKNKEEKLIRVLRDLGDVGKVPKLVAILVGDNLESELYLKLKRKAAERLGIDFEMKKFSGKSLPEITSFIQEKNNNPSVDGIMIELPLPKEISPISLISLIGPDKDVDCLTAENLRLLEEGKPKFVPPTVKAVGEILKEAVRLGILGDLGDLKVVVVGSEGTVGKGS